MPLPPHCWPPTLRDKEQQQKTQIPRARGRTMKLHSHAPFYSFVSSRPPHRHHSLGRPLLGSRSPRSRRTNPPPKADWQLRLLCSPPPPRRANIFARVALSAPKLRTPHCETPTTATRHNFPCSWSWIFYATGALKPWKIVVGTNDVEVARRSGAGGPQEVGVWRSICRITSVPQRETAASAAGSSLHFISELLWRFDCVSGELMGVQ